jgi:phosphoribosylamine---glycine ligase
MMNEGHRGITTLNILVIGSGGREHAIAWKLSQAKGVKQVICSPGNPGCAEVGHCFAAEGAADWLALAERHKVGLTVVGPEAPLVDGVVDLFREKGRLIVGPTQAAARLEGSKVYAKSFLEEHSIPTARSQTVHSVEEGRAALRQFSRPVVLKADGLAAGKGVVIAHTDEEAEHALHSLLSHRQLVIEEYLEGEEISFIVVSDGQRVLAFPPSQDHKRVFDQDQGPNTGGMGAYSDSRLLAPADTNRLLNQVVYPTVLGMSRSGTPFTGFLFVGLMLTSDGPKVLEFNVRLGDPETQALLYRISADSFLDVLLGSARGDLSESALDVDPDPAVCVVLASHGYPGTVRTGDVITGIEATDPARVKVFQAGTKRDDEQLVTSGGRVLGVTGSGATLGDARDVVYSAIQHIRFAGMHYRKDIGSRGLSRYN